MVLHRMSSLSKLDLVGHFRSTPIRLRFALFHLIQKINRFKTQSQAKPFTYATNTEADNLKPSMDVVKQYFATYPFLFFSQLLLYPLSARRFLFSSTFCPSFALCFICVRFFFSRQSKSTVILEITVNKSLTHNVGVCDKLAKMFKISPFNWPKQTDD